MTLLIIIKVLTILMAILFIGYTSQTSQKLANYCAYTLVTILLLSFFVPLVWKFTIIVSIVYILYAFVFMGNNRLTELIIIGSVIIFFWSEKLQTLILEYVNIFISFF